ncbi:MAG: tetratricopeptide repeat protein [Bryobacterales bacterium]|nr:tetratricopeptide repeat protein [Bryobacterales bacterium]
MTAHDLLLRRDYFELKHHILAHTGLSYYADRDQDLSERIAGRLSSLELDDVAAYLELLRGNPAELDRLVGELTIGETYFFRQAEHFELLRTVIVPAMLARNRFSRQLRIWSAGCATGAEPYSLSILLRTAFEQELRGWDVLLLATDINVEYLARARHARFGDWALRETPPEWKARCFQRDGEKWRLRPEFRDGVQFRQHNLMSDEHPAGDGIPFDLIVCRNVLIYFSQPTIRTVAKKFYGFLRAGGWLVVGHAEPNPENFSLFDIYASKRATAYVRGLEPVAGDWMLLAEPGVDLAGSVPLPVPVAKPVESVPAVPPPPAPASPVAPLEEVRRLADCGEWTKARDAAELLVHREPLHAAAHFTLGLILEQRGEWEQARDELRRAIYLDRGFVLAHYYLGLAQEQAGQREPANRSLTTALRLARGKAAGELLPHGDGITAGDLASLAQTHLEWMG